MSEHFDGSVTFEWDQVPRSVNAGGGGVGKHWGQTHKDKMMWEGVWCALALKARLPKRLALIEANIELQFSDPGRKRDIENLRHPVAKPLADALVKAGFIPDDDDHHFRVTGFRINKDVKLEPKRGARGGRAKAEKIVVTLKYRFAPGSARS